MPASDAPAVLIHAADGARACIQLDGAQVTSWIPAGAAEDRLFVSARAEYGAGASVRGGIPICFPQFGPFAPPPQHGFARTTRWRRVDEAGGGPGDARLGRTRRGVADARPSVERDAWPHAVAAELLVQVQGAAVAVRLDVLNTGDSALTFTAAFHPYFAVGDAFATSVHGLAGLTYRDALRDGSVFHEDAASLAITGPIDRIYYGAPEVLEVHEPDRSLRVEMSGFEDAVVWNPGAAITAAKRDFVPGDERRMLCVEAAVVRRPVSLAPGARWSGTQRMIAG